MKSKFFVVAAIFAVALIFGGMTKAHADDGCPDALMYEDDAGVCVCAVELYGDLIEQVDDECVPIEGYQWVGGTQMGACEGYTGTSPCFPMVERIEDGYVFEAYRPPLVPSWLIDTDGDGLADIDDDCPDDYAETDDGCPVSTDGLIDGAGLIELPPDDSNLDDYDGDFSNTQEWDGGGACSLIHNSTASSALPLIVLALSLVPITIRRSRSSK